MVEVTLQYNPLCPYCKSEIKVLRILFKKLKEEGIDVPFFEEFIGGNSVTASKPDFAAHVYTRDWINQFGTERQQGLLAEMGEIFDRLGEKGMTSYPTLRIAYYDGVARREIVIKGFPRDVEKRKDEVVQFLKNIETLIHYAVEEERKHGRL